MLGQVTARSKTTTGPRQERRATAPKSRSRTRASSSNARKNKSKIRTNNSVPKTAAGPRSIAAATRPKTRAGSEQTATTACPKTAAGPRQQARAWRSDPPEIDGGVNRRSISFQQKQRVEPAPTAEVAAASGKQPGSPSIAIMALTLGGYNGYRIPDDRYRAIWAGSLVPASTAIHGVVDEGGYPRFQYGGFWFRPVDLRPESWSDDWYDNDDVYCRSLG